jgi:hypothetical protein
MLSSKDGIILEVPKFQIVQSSVALEPPISAGKIEIDTFFMSYGSENKLPAPTRIADVRDLSSQPPSAHQRSLHAQPRRAWLPQPHAPQLAPVPALAGLVPCPKAGGSSLFDHPGRCRRTRVLDLDPVRRVALISYRFTLLSECYRETTRK